VNTRLKIFVIVVLLIVRRPSSEICGQPL